MTLKKYACLALVIGPLCRPYLFPGTDVGLGTVLLFINCILLLINLHKAPFLFPRFFLFFIIYAAILPVLNGAFHGYGFISTYIVLGLFFLNIWFYSSFVELNYVKRYLRFIVYFAAGILITQEIMYAVWGHRFAALIPFLPSCYSNQGISTEAIIQTQIISARSSSIFLEPSHLAQYLIVFLAVTLGDNYSLKKNISFDAIFVTLAILLTRSGVGMLCMLVLWSAFVIFNQISLSKKISLVFPLIIILVIVGHSIISSNLVGSDLLSRVDELSLSNAQDTRFYSSGAIRIYLGYFIFSEMLVSDKILGVGSGSIGQIVDTSSFSTIFANGGLNNMQSLLIGFGIIGTILFMSFLIHLLRNNNFVGKLVLISFLIISFLESSFLEAYTLLFIVIGLMCATKTSLSKQHLKNYNR